MSNRDTNTFCYKGYHFMPCGTLYKSDATNKDKLFKKLYSMLMSKYNGFSYATFCRAAATCGRYADVFYCLEIQTYCIPFRDGLYSFVGPFKQFSSFQYCY